MRVNFTWHCPAVVVLTLTFGMASAFFSLAYADSVQVRGKLVDDETGEPVTSFVIQAGKFDVGDEGNVTWGFSESRSSSRTGDFRTTIRWDEGWTARVLVDGYLPMPVVSEPPPPGVESIEVTLRLKRGRVIAGAVVDHEGNPVEGASVFAVGPTRISLAAGKAVQSHSGEEDERALKVLTDAKGRFEIPIGEVKGLVVSSAAIDAWPIPLPDEGEEAKVQLPKPTGAEIKLDIKGAGENQKVFFQLLTHKMDGFDGIGVEREFEIENGSTLALPGLTPGEYQFCRSRMLRTGDMGHGVFLDRTFVTIDEGDTLTIDFTRPPGLQVNGQVLGLEEAGLDKALIYVLPAGDDDPVDVFRMDVTLDARETDAEGKFTTETLKPGKYRVVAHGYRPPTPEERFRSGIRRPSHMAVFELEIRDSNMAEDIELTIKPREDK